METMLCGESRLKILVAAPRRPCKLPSMPLQPGFGDSPRRAAEIAGESGFQVQPWMIPSDLAPGDAKSLQRDWSDLELHRIESIGDPRFDAAFGALWSEFGAIGEIEQAEILGLRMLWDPSQIIDGCSMRYRMMLVTADDRFAAVRDHTAIVLEDEPGAVVHLSHNLVAPEWRRTGLAGWLRALPITTARSVLSAQKRPVDAPITLV
ncbi:MAG: hypothetical protein M0Q93_08100, partial [Terrimicrobiaceae bacterium]|nr:hypothetical protein [Terrimicrobiaceae bacterium]